MSADTISPTQLNAIVQSGLPVQLIDVRTPAEYREMHIDFARNLPLAQLDAAGVAALRGDASRPLFVICRSGGRGRLACEKLQRQGVTQVVNVAGGIEAWELEGLPVVHGEKTISLERQVRIAAGALVLLGVATGIFVHLYWLALAAFVGAGLMFAGLTDTCGISVLLARMPWNSGSGKNDSLQSPHTQGPASAM